MFIRDRRWQYPFGHAKSRTGCAPFLLITIGGLCTPHPIPKEVFPNFKRALEQKVRPSTTRIAYEA